MEIRAASHLEALWPAPRHGGNLGRQREGAGHGARRCAELRGNLVDFIAAMLVIVGGPYLLYGLFSPTADKLTVVILAIAVGWGAYHSYRRIAQNTADAHKYQYPRQYPPNWAELRQDILRRDGHRCGNCGSTTDLRVHHIVPLSKGGSNDPGNLRTLCDNCHKLLHPHMR